jgi:hypothetical protein
MSNTRIWDQVNVTDPSATKNFTGMGGFKGTAIKPTYLMRKATEVFGPCGEGWGWTVLESLRRRRPSSGSHQGMAGRSTH